MVPNGSDGTFEFQFFDDGVPVGGGSGVFTDEPQTSQVILTESTLLENGAELLTFALEIPEGTAGTFDTFELVIEGDLVQNPAQNGDLVSGGVEDSGFLERLSAPAAFGGLGLSVFGVDASSDTTEGISGTIASLGSNAASEQGGYAIAQVVVPAGSNLVFQFRFFDDGSEVSSGTGTIGGGMIPEPACLSMVLIAWVSCVASRRRTDGPYLNL